ncbi:MAG: twin-arginine translocase subunit TatB [Microthrixaceae bacterium]|jgi:sec-independent protein translocase protein TatB|nr:twin-arginine translocase subunit TatB [Microthrixaceae bacterium]
MFNVGGPEIMVVLLVALVVLGPEQLPKAMRTFGNVMAQVRKLSNGFQDEMRSAMNAIDITATPSTSTSGSTAPSSVSGQGNDSAGASASAGGPGASTGPATPGSPSPGQTTSGPSSADRAAG